MKIAVTGANGFVGRAVLARLAEAGVEGLPLVRRPCELAGERVVGDLADRGLTAEDLAGVSTVVHLAARTHVMNETSDDPLAEYRRTNVGGTAHLLEQAAQAGVERFVFMSSIKAVGEWSLPGEPLGPETEPRPQDDYGHSKLEAEALVKSVCEQADIAFKIIRPPLVHGRDAKGNLARLGSLLRTGVPLPLASLRNARSIVSVDNLADATVAACLTDRADGAILHIADLTVSTPQLIRLIGDATGQSARLFAFPPRLLRRLAQISGLGNVGERLFGSLELATGTSFAGLGWRPPVAGADALRSSFAASTDSR